MRGIGLERIIAIPRIGFYSEVIEKAVRGIGLNVMPTTVITQDVIKKGVKHSSDMMCFPFKVVLGCFIDALDKGANTLIMWGDQDTLCRIGQYYNIADQILHDLGYKFEMINIPPTLHGLVSKLCQMTKKNPIYITRHVKMFIISNL
jgi:predicted nucleotide-binding protein (sugar kinase/HSP70/actin superfamily)